MVSRDKAGSARGDAQQPQAKLSLAKIPSAIQRYGLAIISVALALLLTLLLQHYEFHHVVLAPFLLAIALTAWYAGVGAAALSIVLSSLCFLYFFAPPIYRLAFTVADVPAILILVCFGLLITGFSAVRRRIEGQLLQAHDELITDITERKKTEEKLRRSEAYLAEAEKLSKTASWAWSPVTQKSLYWSEEMFRIFGFDPQQGLPPDETFWERVHPEDRDGMVELMRNAVHEKREYVHEHRIVMPDGRVKHIHAIGRPSLDAGEVVEYVGTLADITEHKQAEQARRELEEQWKAAYESNPTMYFIIDVAGEIVSVNTFGAEQLGYSVGELIGQPVLNVFYEPDRSAVQKHAKKCFEQPGQTMRWEARKVRKDGTMLWVRETANAVVLKTRPVLLVVCENITEQKHAEDAARRSEKELSDVIETMPAMAFSIRPDGTTAFVNRQVLEYTGLSAETISGPGWQSTVHPDDVEGHLSKWRASLVSGAPFENEVRHRSANGDYRWFLVRAVALRDEHGNILKWYGTLTDIEDRKRAEQALRRSQAYLSEAQRLSHTGSWARNAATGETTHSSEEHSRLFGFDPELGLPSFEEFSEHIHPEDRAKVAEAFDKAIRERIDFEVDLRTVMPDHTIKCLHGVGHPVISAAGDLIEYVGTVVDVSEQKRAEEALRRSEAYLAEAQRLSKTGSWAFRPGMAKPVYWSEEMFRIWGFDPRQGPPDNEAAWQRIHPEDLKASLGKQIEGASSGKYKTDIEHDHRIVMPDQTVKYLHSSSHPVFDSNGNVLEYIGTSADVTERKRAEQALQRSESYLVEAQRLSHTGSWAYSHATERAIYWSEETFRIFGLDPQRSDPPYYDEFIRLIHPEDRDRFRENTLRCFREKVGFTQEYRLMLPDGTVKYIHEIGHPVLDGAAKLIEYLGTLIDVTERKRAEEALRRSEAYLAEAQRLSKTGSWAWDPRSDKMLFCSEEVYRIFGVDPQQGVPHIDLLLERVHPEDHDRVRAESVRGGRHKTEHTLEYRLLLPDGTIKYVLSKRHPVFDDAGEIVEVIGTTVDVTERKRAEERLRESEGRFRTSVDHLTDALFIHDDQDDKGRVLDVNQQACDSLGYTREELIGMTAFDYDPSVDAQFSLSIKERLARGETFSFESAHRRKDGTEFPVEVRARPFWHGDHRFGLALVRDISERKRAEAELERLRQLEADLAQINRVSMMGELAASLAHEVKQPIAAAVTNAKTSLRWLQREPPDIGEAREAVSRIVKDVLRAADIIDRNRALYRRDKPKREPVDLNELIREITALLRDAASRHSVSICAELEGGLPPMAADRVQMQQVLINLMLNGIEAMKDTGGELTLRSKATEDGQILLSVSDVGVGLPSEKIDQIFDAFFTTKAQGTGMGLCISRRIIESHGGRLWATSNSGRGATFHFTVPTEVEPAEMPIEKTGS